MRAERRVARRVEHWSTPSDTARRAGPAMVEDLLGLEQAPQPLAPMPAFWSDQYELRLQAFGSLGLGV